MASIVDGAVTLDDGRTFTADAVIVTAGAVPLSPPIEGLDHALPLRTAGDALRLRTEIDAASSVVIVGGGATGVQLAGAAAATHPNLDVTLVDGADDVARRVRRRRSVPTPIASSVAVASTSGSEPTSMRSAWVR